MLCAKCNQNPACTKAERFPDRCFGCHPAKGRCQHCLTRKATRPRDLCFGCYGDLTVRTQYPTATNHAPTGEPTEAELDQMIAEQLANLPDWWNLDQRQSQEECGFQSDD